MKRLLENTNFHDTRISISEETSGNYSKVVGLFAGDVTAFLSGINFVLSGQSLPILAEKFIAFLLQVIPETARGCVFMPDGKGNLAPIATKIKHNANHRFAINKSILKNVIRAQVPISSFLDIGDSRKMGVVGLPFGSVHGFGVIHLEVDCTTTFALEKLTELAVQIIGIISPKVESFQLQNKVNTLVSSALSTINAVIEAKDTYTSGHSQRVATYSQAIAAELGLSASDQDNLLVSAICHDIGKIGVPDAILKKPGLLSIEEFEEMKAHPLIGAAIVEGSENYKDIIGGIKYHHERFDGTGYPDHLAGEAIPLFGRIIAAADALDAMTSGRSYSGYMSIEEAVVELSRKTDLFDPQILSAMLKAESHGRISQRTGTQISVLKAG
jgi:HD-GYP domain-containing protein (c-di-GMP phosphodiesterase class II)